MRPPGRPGSPIPGRSAIPGRPGSPQYRQGGIYTTLKERERLYRQRLDRGGTCPHCNGSGTKWLIFDCSACGGTGRYYR